MHLPFTGSAESWKFQVLNFHKFHEIKKKVSSPVFESFIERFNFFISHKLFLMYDKVMNDFLHLLIILRQTWQASELFILPIILYQCDYDIYIYFSTVVCHVYKMFAYVLTTSTSI